VTIIVTNEMKSTSTLVTCILLNVKITKLESAWDHTVNTF